MNNVESVMVSKIFCVKFFVNHALLKRPNTYIEEEHWTKSGASGDSCFYNIYI